MPYSFDSRVRYSEVGTDQKLTYLSLVDYFQDCSTFHSEQCGNGLDFLKAKDQAWMIVYWQIDLVRLPGLCEQIRIQTHPYGFKGFYGTRNYALLDGEGHYLAKANSVWVLVDTKKGHPARITEDISGKYQVEEPLEMEYLPRKINLPEHMIEKERFQVVRHHLDTNGHVNNGQYIGMAEEYLPEGFGVSRLRVEYRNQARLHDTILAKVCEQEDAVTVALCSEADGKPYAIIEFTGSMQGK